MYRAAALMSAHWQFLSAIVVATWTVVAYLASRQREAAWKRTEFMFAQLRYLDSNPGVSEAVAILEGWNNGVSIDDVFLPNSGLTPERQLHYRMAFDRLLNLLWCVAYACLELHTITPRELGGFGWYLWRVREAPTLAAYCRDNGFADVLRAAELLDGV